MSFKDIIGQDKAINILKGYIEQSRLRGGYLFTGPEGVGKKLLAKELAKAVNCEEDSSDSCGACASCLRIENNQHPDVHILESEDAQIKIESIRQLQREINFRPFEARFKVFIIDNAHDLTAEASNALLKVLEEPPRNSLIILISDKPALLFKTIVSRCKTLKFTALKRADLEGLLRKDYRLDESMAHFLAYSCEGRLGRALKLKDTDILREKNMVIDKFALSRKPHLENIAVQKKEDFERYLNILAAWFRDIYFVKIGIPHRELINLDRKNELLKASPQVSFLDLSEILDTISDSIFRLEQNINTRLLLHNLGAHLWKA